MNETEVRFKRHPEAAAPKLWSTRNGLLIPAFAKSNDGHKVKIVVPPHTPKLIRTGITLILASGVTPFILTRGGHRGLQVLHSPVALDPDVEVTFVMHNGSLETQYIEHGDFVAYLIFLRGFQLSLEEVL